MKIDRALPEYKQHEYRTLGAYWQVKAQEGFDKLRKALPDCGVEFHAVNALDVAKHNKGLEDGRRN